jgi:hypothetical protein
VASGDRAHVFGPDGKDEFNWLAAVPQGTVRGSCTDDGMRHGTTGISYHDHNWGNGPDLHAGPRRPDHRRQPAVSFDRKRDLARNRLVQDLPWLKRTAARLTGFDGAYLRFAGQLTVEHHKGGYLIESFADEAIWELMYFGHGRND